MSNTEQIAEVILKVNNQEAIDKFNELEKKAKDLRQKFAEAFKSGDPRAVKEINGELTKVNREMARMQLNASNIRAAMKRLNEATPRELQQTIKNINAELNSGRVPRGTKQWEYYTNQLKLAQAELRKVRREMEETEGLFTRMNRKINDWGTSIAAGAAAMTGIVLSGKSAVKAYADMQAEEANVRKFTGMTEEQVKKLNDEFKKMDTRTSREELNKLAQEAGRLGKTSEKDVLGFVRAANQINVALDEIGKGATLELSKLTDIFGDEKRLGTERALLAVGSVINDLSQNCTAGAAYMVDYAKRMAGVGAQAKMTIPQIMSYAAVLDSQGQNVEASATAMSQLIMKMYQDPAKIAKAAGMEVKAFSEILKKDANAALIELLKTLNSYGGIESLATIFDEMGSDGARASAAIAALAGSVDMLVWEQGEANKAFREATSVTNEYTVQNTTAQAKLDKAMKGFTERAVTLGQKLMPVINNCISGTSMLMRVLLVFVDFVAKHHKALITTAASIAAYNLIINAHIIRLKLASAWTTTWSLASTKLSGIAAASKLAISALCNVVEYFTNGLQVNYAMQQRWRTAMAAMKFSSWTGLILSAAAAVYLFATRVKEATTAQERLQKIKDQAIKSSHEEINRIKLMIKFAKDETNALQERLKITEELNEIIPNFNAQIDKTTGKFIASKEALEEYIRSLIRLAEIERAKEELGKLGKEKAELTEKYTKAKKNLEGARNNRSNGRTYTTSYGVVGNTGMDSASYFEGIVNDLGIKLKNVQKREEEIINAYKDAALFVSTKESKPTGKSLPDIPLTGRGESEKERKEREKAEREAKKKQREEEAEARKLLKEHIDSVKAARIKEETANLASYTSGQKNYLQYVETKDAIERRYLDDSIKVLEEHGKKDTKIYEEQLNKREQLEARAADRRRNATLHDIEREHKKNEDDAVSDFYDPDSPIFQNQKALNQRLLEEDIRYLREKLKLYSEGSEEWVKINDEMEDRLSRDQQDKQRETAEAYLAFETEFRKGSGSKREMMELEILDELHKQGLISEEEYQKAVAKIKQKFREEDREKNRTIQNEYSDMVENLYYSFSDLFDALGQKGCDFWENLSNAAETAFSTIGAMLSQYSAYSNAERDVELAKIEKRYDKEINAAGNNTKKREALEKKKEAELSKTRKKYNEKNQKVEIAKALAQTASAAISAYAAALQIGGLAGLIMAPIAAAVATTFGMMQVATIRKQHEAEAQGYYSGGFTRRDPNDRKEVGVVHANEFVANHQAVASPVLSPVLNLIDHAQRTNTVGSLTAEDVSNALGIGGGVSARGERQLSQTDRDKAIAESMAALTAVSAKNSDAIDRLSRQIEEGLMAQVIMDGEQGLYRKLSHFEKLRNNPKR